MNVLLLRSEDRLQISQTDSHFNRVRTFRNYHKNWSSKNALDSLAVFCGNLRTFSDTSFPSAWPRIQSGEAITVVVEQRDFHRIFTMDTVHANCSPLNSFFFFKNESKLFKIFAVKERCIVSQTTPKVGLVLVKRANPLIFFSSARALL